MSRKRRRTILPLRVLGSVSVNRISSGLAIEPISLATPGFQRIAKLTGGPDDGITVTNAQRAWPFMSWGRPTTAALVTVVGDQRRFDLHRAQAMAADVDDIIDAAHNPQVAILILRLPSPVRYVAPILPRHPGFR